MDPRDRILGPIASADDPDTISVDFADLVAKLILSGQWIFESIRLREFPSLLAKFGYDGVRERFYVVGECAIADRVVVPPDDSGTPTTAQLDADLASNSPMIKVA